MRTVRMAILAVACTALLAGTSFAKGKARNQDSRRGNSVRVFAVGNQGVGNQAGRNEGVWNQGRSQYPSRNQREVWNGSRNGGYYPRSGSRPPGWNQGQKNGWGNCNLPPGLAKKQGCVSSYGNYGNRPYEGVNRRDSGWYRHNGRYDDRYDRYDRWDWRRDRDWRNR